MLAFIGSIIVCLLYMILLNFILDKIKRMLNQKPIDFGYFIAHLSITILTISFAFFRNHYPYLHEYFIDAIVYGAVIYGILTTLFGLTLILLRKAKKEELHGKWIKPLL